MSDLPLRRADAQAAALKGHSGITIIDDEIVSTPPSQSQRTELTSLLTPYTITLISPDTTIKPKKPKNKRRPTPLDLTQTNRTFRALAAHSDVDNRLNPIFLRSEKEVQDVTLKSISLHIESQKGAEVLTEKDKGFGYFRAWWIRRIGMGCLGLMIVLVWTM